MAINLNHVQFGSQFQEFVNLAARNAGDPDSIVCLDEHERGRAPEQLLGPNGEARGGRRVGLDFLLQSSGVVPVCRRNTALNAEALENPQFVATRHAGMSVDSRSEHAFLTRWRAMKSIGVRPVFSLNMLNTWVREYPMCATSRSMSILSARCASIHAVMSENRHVTLLLATGAGRAILYSMSWQRMRARPSSSGASRFAVLPASSYSSRQDSARCVPHLTGTSACLTIAA